MIDQLFLAQCDFRFDVALTFSRTHWVYRWHATVNGEKYAEEITMPIGHDTREQITKFIERAEGILRNAAAESDAPYDDSTCSHCGHKRRS